MCEENKRESFPQEAQDPQPIETQTTAPAEVRETAAPGVEAAPQEGTAQEAAPAEVSETAAPGAEETRLTLQGSRPAMSPCLPLPWLLSIRILLIRQPRRLSSCLQCLRSSLTRMER